MTITWKEQEPENFDLMGIFPKAAEKFGYFKEHQAALPKELIFEWNLDRNQDKPGDRYVWSRIPKAIRTHRRVVFYSPLVIPVALFFALAIFAVGPRDSRLAITIGGAILALTGAVVWKSKLELELDFDDRVANLLNFRAKNSAFSSAEMFARALEAYHGIRDCGPKFLMKRLERRIVLLGSARVSNDIYRLMLPPLLEAAKIAWDNQAVLDQTTGAGSSGNSGSKDEVAATSRRAEYDARIQTAAAYIGSLETSWFRVLNRQAHLMTGLGWIGFFLAVLGMIFLATGFKGVS